MKIKSSEANNSFFCRVRENEVSFVWIRKSF